MMDAVKASELETKLKGQMIGGWTIDHLIGHGKSAAVFMGTSGTDRSAVKVFDDELIQKYGDESQLARIDRELTLVGKSHRNLVKILGGGFDEITNNHYIVMEHLDGPNLAVALQNIPQENVPSLIAQLASAARYLEGLELCHRDIKPENICILENFSRLVLLDFGVIRPIGVSGLTDGEGISAFVGTLQYSSPEFLLRNEIDSIEGWRALTFYQIGGVLHDLIMRKPLFKESSEPFARLVNAVQYEKADIKSADYPPYLVGLAENALTKDPQLRIKLLDWNSFDVSKAGLAPHETAKDRVLKRSLLAKAQTPEPPNQIKSERLANELREEVLTYLGTAVRSIRRNSEAFPPVNISRDPANKNRTRIRLGKSTDRGLHDDLTIAVRLSVLDAVGSVISIVGRAFCGGDDPASNDQDESKIFDGVYNSTNQALIYDAFEEWIYLILDMAQTLSLQRKEANTVPSEWLPLPQGKV